MDIEWAMPSIDHVLRVVAAVVLGGLIGLEREIRDKPAGFRTIILICVGACIFTVVSQVAGAPDSQRTRIAAQIVSGIGFLGAGAILRDRANVMGLTTATTIWAVAAIGMAVGFGYIGLAFLGTVAILAALFLFDAIEQWVGDRRDIQEYLIVMENTDQALATIGGLVERSQLKERKRSFYEEGTSLLVHIVAMGSKTNHERLRTKLVRSEEYSLRAI